MFKNFSNMKLGLKITSGFIFVLIISLVSGIYLGKNINSPYVIFGLILTIVAAMGTAVFVSKSITNSIGQIINHLSSTAGNLNIVSREITDNGHSLAEGATEQAASIQETSSTLEESASMVHQTTQNTKEADVLAKHAKTAADKGNVEMNTMLSSMEELKKSSSEISKIIKVIDEIAFQTNILSLNAAVEAARAGDAGKGFAVVAEEVRNLAQRSAQAAKDTAGIIEKNINLSEKCLEITEQVNGSLSTIKDETHKVSELLEEISTASQEQEIGIRQINQAVAQMESVISANATTAQNTATSADQLSLYSDDVKNVISSLVGLIEGTERIQANINRITEAPKMKNLLGLPKRENPPKMPKTAPERKSGRSKKEHKEFIEPKVNNSSDERRSAKKAPKEDLKGAKVINPEDIIPLDDF